MFDPKQETQLIAVNFNDRLNGRVILMVNNVKKCVVAQWIEENPAIQFDREISNSELYKALESLAEAQSVEVQNDFMGELLKGI